MPKPATILVLARSAACRQGRLQWGDVIVACALGDGGCRVRKRESDGATPIGRWRVREVFYRADRLPRPRTHLPARTLRPDDGWCDAVGDRNYNRPVRHPYPASAEKLWRSDTLYDLIVVLDHNRRPRSQGRGSAIFLHVAGEGYPPTAGCIALQRAHLLRVLSRLDRGSVIDVRPAPRKKRPE
ncbi:MAG TPA: L,D-transpeptidase family protein [Hyphomicrobiaceae bacterium]|nr:L,D-transpeptidase family protein [Hyphomicrobiaceae bacterium]